MSLFSLVKKLLKARGIHVYRNSTLPRNVDFFLDFNHLTHSKPVEVVFDVGANVGNWSKEALNAFPNSRVLAFEPVAAVYAVVSQLNEPRLQTFNYALGAKEDEVVLHHRKNSVWNSLQPFNNSVGSSDGSSETVTIQVLDGVCENLGITHIDLLKTDTEGFDLAVIEGSLKMFQENRIDAVLSEVTFLEWDKTHTSFLKILETLTTHGFFLYGLYDFAGDFETSHANALFLRKAHYLA